ncbi:MAG TPA: VanZ family protein [Tepidiformaceae bacterium]|nr:VanZ family protein [Tepidiformaceae bacterium]
MRLWLTALAGWAALIFILSSFPNPPGDQSQEWRSIAGHLVEYFVLAFLAAKVIELWRPGWSMPTVAFVAWLAAVAYGISDEFHQSLVPRRDASVFDVLIDAAGAAAGVVLWAWFSRGAR